MRTTIRIDDDVLAAARSIANAEGSKIGEVVSRLLRRALAPDAVEVNERGFPVFSVSPDARPITVEMVRDALDEESR